MGNYINEDGKKFCGFCGKTQEDHKVYLQAGPICQICNECVDVASQNILNKNKIIKALQEDKAYLFGGDKEDN